MNKNVIYTVIGLAILIIVGIWLYKKYKSVNPTTSNSTISATGRMSNSNGSIPVIKYNCLAQYNAWQNWLNTYNYWNSQPPSQLKDTKLAEATAQLTNALNAYQACIANH